MWPRTDLMELLGITHPVIQAPMAGSTTPELVAAVSNAGGLGSLGCARFGPDDLREKIAAIRGSTNQAYNLNFFVHAEPEHDAASTAAMQARLAPYYEELGIGDVPAPTSIYPRFDEAMLAVLLEARPSVASFHFGMPDRAVVSALRDAGIRVLTSATTVGEARELEAAGADAIIAQGAEAGGHRGTLEPPFDKGLVGTFALVPQVVDAVKVPVIAAGGIADGRGIAAAFALGASGVQIGTAFLTCPESGIARLYHDALLRSGDDSSRVTRTISGRPARGLRNRYVAEMEDMEDAALAFPLQYSLTGRCRPRRARRAPTNISPCGPARPSPSTAPCRRPSCWRSWSRRRRRR